MESMIQLALYTLVNRHDALRATISSCHEDYSVEKAAASGPSSSMKSGYLQVDRKLNSLTDIDKILKINPPISCRCDTNEQTLQSSPPVCVACALSEEISKAFNMSRQLFRCAIFSPSSQEAVICLVFHHLISDGMSLFVITSELLALLRDGSNDKRVTQSEEHVDFLSTSSGVASKRVIDKWVSLLSSAESCLDMWNRQYGRHISDSKNPHAASDVFLELSVKSTRAISYLSSAYRVSPAVVIAVAYSLALSYVTGERDIVIGMVSANRTRSMASAVGYFANTLPLRINLNTQSASNLQSLIKKVRKNWSMILAGGVDLLDLIPLVPCLQYKSSGRESTVHTSPLQVLFSFYDVGEDGRFSNEFIVDGVEVECKVDVPKPGHTHADLWMEANPNQLNESGNQTLHWEYRTSILTHSIVECLHTILCRYLETAADAKSLGCDCINPLDLSIDVSYLSLSVVDGSKCFEKNREVKDISSLCYIQRFQQKVFECPHSPAFKLINNSVYTYRDVHSMTSVVALYLTKMLKVKPGDRVALLLPRDVNLYLILLAVLKCGAAYVPITNDAALPENENRLIQTLKVAGAKVLLTVKSLWSGRQTRIGCVALLDDMISNMKKHTKLSLSSADLGILASLEEVYSPDLLVYILFTSGTTGEPKAVGITDTNLNATFNNFLRLVSPQETRLTLAATGINFDSHVLDSLAPLLNGSCLVVAKSALDLSNDGGTLFLSDDLVRNSDFNDSGISLTSSHFDGITFAFATPSTASVVSYPHSMEAIMIGGEVFTRACYFNTKHIPRVLNIYGPTECSVFMTAIEVPKLPPTHHHIDTKEIARIGWPLPDVKVMIMNDAKNIVPIGRIGELHIAGRIVSSSGYLNAAEKNTQCFFPSPLNPKERVYATGDLMYMLPNRMLQFVGRKDDQVKLRGMRLHLQKVTDILSSHSEVRYAKSLVINPATSSATLVSFVTPKNVDKSSLLEHARHHLPPYMVPSVVLTEDEMIDYKLSKEYIQQRALIALEEGGAASSVSGKGDYYIAAPDQLKLASEMSVIFGRVLNVKEYPIKGDFFAFGGHSLLCFQLMKEINREMNVRVSLTHVMQNSTPVDLARAMLDSKIERDLKGLCGPQVITQPSIRSVKSASFINVGESTNVFDYLEPVPEVPLSRDIQEYFSQSQRSDNEEAASISNLLAEETGFYIPPASLIHYSSMDVLQAHLKLKTVLSFTSLPQKVVAVLTPPSSAYDNPIFFIHSGVIGWSLSYVKLAKKIGGHGVAVQRTPEAPDSTFEEMVAFYLEQVQSVQSRGPYKLVGVCYGAYVVYEMTRQLVEKGERMELSVLINNSPVNEKRPAIFNREGHPLPNTMAHPLHFFETTLKVARDNVDFKELYNVATVDLDMLTRSLLQAYPWLPFSASELAGAYLQFIKTLRPAWFGYTPKPIKRVELVKRVLLIRNKENASFDSNDFGLLKLINNADTLKVIVSPTKLGLLNEEQTVEFISDIIRQNLA